MVWAQPLSDDFSKYFYTHKTTAMPLKGEITIAGVKSICNNDCLLSEDSFRAQMSYPMNYFFSTMQQILPDGRSMGVVTSDGIGSSLQTKTKVSSEDYLTLDGKAYKMDLTVVTDADSEDLLSVKHLKSVDRAIDGVEASCDLLYKPK